MSAFCEQKARLPTDHQVDGEARALWPFGHFKDSQRF